MTNREFATEVFTAAQRSSDISPVFITAQAALESGWGKSRVGKNNLFGIKAGSGWQGKKVLVRTTEFMRTPDWKPNLPEKVISVKKMPSGKYKYDAELYFRDYESLEACLADHSAILSKPHFAHAWAYRKSPERFVEKLQAGTMKYATDPNYVNIMKQVFITVKKLLA